MKKKAALFFALSVFVIGLCGCETTKGAVDGARLDLQTANRGAAKGWQALLAMDSWVQKNLW